MNGRSYAAALALLCLLAGCGEAKPDAKDEPRKSVEAADAATIEAAAGDEPSPTPSITLPVAPASEAGGLCRKFDYAKVEKAIGVRFDVAAASGASGATQVCVLQRAGSAAPDLVLSKIPVEKPTQGDEEAGSPAEAEVAAFRADYQPADGKRVNGLGKAAYSRVAAAEAGGGAQVEIGWLGTQSVYVLAYTTAPGTNTAAATKAIPRLTALATQVV